MANTLKIKRGLAAGVPQGQLAEPLFTTDTYDLYIGKGSGGNQRFQKYIASGTSSQFLKGDGSLDSTSYQPLITAGTSLQYYRGDKTFQTLDTAAVPENGAIYFTEPRVRATVLTGLNLAGGGTIAATDSILQAFGKVQNQISALVGSVYYAGTWNASTNTPSLASGTGTKGYYYIVTVAGSTNLDGITDWKVGDWAIFNGTNWDKVDNTDAVSSVNGFTGAVNLALDNISDVSAASPTNAQLLRFNGTSSLWENWTPTFEPALTKGNLSSGDTSYLTVTGGTGAVIGSGTTISILASGVVNGGLTLTTTGNSGAATKSYATLNIPEYTLSGLGGVPTTRTITINGTALDLSSDRSWSVGTVTGTGTTGTIPKWSSASALNDSVIIQSGSDILIGATADQGKLQIDGTATGGIMLNCSNTQFGFTIKNTSSSNKKWDLSPSGNDLYLNESGSTAVMQFKAGGGDNIRLYTYTSNGFLKTSGGTGTLTVDTTSYLPLGGGTLTGALSGTSATFSSNLYISGGSNTNVGNGIHAYYESNYAQIQLNGATGSIIDFSTSGTDYIGRIIYTNSTKQFDFITNSLTALTIASTGAATFSGNIISQGTYIDYQNTSYVRFSNSGGATRWGYIQHDGTDLAFANDISGGKFTFNKAATFSSSVTVNGDLKISNALIGGDVNYNIGINYNTGGTPEFNYYGGTTSSKFKVTSTGAATFSSSVTAGTSVNGTSVNAIGTQSTFRITSNYAGSGDIPAGTLIYLDDSTYSSLGIIPSSAGTAGSKIAAVAYNGSAWRSMWEFSNVSSGNPNLLLVKNGGNVGIGESNPSSYKLQVKGADGSGIQYEDTNAVKTFLGSYLSKGILGTLSNHDVGIWANNLVKMTITSGGNVGIGYDAPGYKLYVKESATNYASVFENTLSTGYGIQVLVNNSGTTYKYFSGYSTSAAAEKIIIYSNGDIVNANGSYGTISDITLKENIIDATPKLQDLLKLKVRNFNFIGDETKQIGFIAQEFEQVFPSMIDYDDSSNLKSIKTSVLVPILVKAIQELKQELDILKNKN